MATRNKRSLGLFALTFCAWPGLAFAQQQPGPAQEPLPSPAPERPIAPAAADAPAAPANPGSAVVPPATGTEPEPETPPPAAKAADGPPPTVFPPPTTRPPRPKRAKPLRTTVGLHPAAVDFGAEADIVSSAGRPKPPADNRRWTYALRGFLRAPMRIGIGPETGSDTGSQLHSPPRMVGLNSDEWTYINVAPAAAGQIQLAVTNPRVEGHVIIAGDTFNDAGYPHLDKMGGFSQAWVTLKSPALFDTHGGVALTVGAFSERFGAAGPFQQSTGYYGTYLFGRTRVAGESLVLNLDLSENLELVAEHGFGAKVEVTPFRKDNPPILPYLPNQGPTPLGSNFVHHAHASLIYKDWLTVSAHYLRSWTPNDLSEVTQQGAESGSMTIMGGEVHVDHPVAGSAYVGFSYIDAERILPLSDGIQVLHGSTGLVFKNNYFGRLPATSTFLNPIRNGQRPDGIDDTGTLQSLLFQYVVRASPLLGRREPGPDLALALFGMLNHVEATKFELNGAVVAPYALKQDKIKFGAEAQFAPADIVSLGVRFDRVMPDGGNADIAYSALSPRVILHSKWISREYLILNYSRYFLGSGVRPSNPHSQPDPPVPPLSGVTRPDANLVSLTAVVGF